MSETYDEAPASVLINGLLDHIMDGQSVEWLTRTLGLTPSLMRAILQTDDVAIRLGRLQAAVDAAGDVPVPWLEAWAPTGQAAADSLLMAKIMMARTYARQFPTLAAMVPDDAEV